MQLGLNLSYWGMGNDQHNLTLAREADKLGFSVVWAAEAYGSDVVSVLAYVAAQTQRIDVGSAIMQIPARTPAMTAMTAATLDTLSGGRFRLGVGVSGPQVSEGWHGVRFDHPLERTREYVDIVTTALRRERLRYDGQHYTLPLPDGPGKALTLTVHPVRDRVPVYLASIGPRNVRLTGEIADGWLGLFVTVESLPETLALIREGRVAAGRSGLDGFDVCPTIPLATGDDDSPEGIEALAARIKPHHALYIGGMGSREKNFYNQLAVRAGYGDAAREVQARYLAREYEQAAAAVPTELVDRTCLLGSVPRMADRLAALAEAGVTTATVSPALAGGPDEQLAALRAVVDAAERAGL